MTNNSIIIEPIKEIHFKELFSIFTQISNSGTNWPYFDEISEKHFRSIWFAPTNVGFVAMINHQVVGAYFIKQQWPGRGAHVATGQYMVSSLYRGKGIGLILATHSKETAKNSGFHALQYNLVVSTNIAAVNLYQKIGFNIAGTLPLSFDHSKFGLVDTYVMYCSLRD